MLRRCKRFILSWVAFSAGSRRDRQMHGKAEMPVFSRGICRISLMAFVTPHPMLCVCAVFPDLYQLDLAGAMTCETARSFVRSLRSCSHLHLCWQCQRYHCKQPTQQTDSAYTRLHKLVLFTHNFMKNQTGQSVFYQRRALWQQELLSPPASSGSAHRQKQPPQKRP